MNPNLVAGRKSLHNRWRVHKELDDRVNSQRALIGLDGKSILFPEQKQFAAKQQALEWREQRLRVGWTWRSEIGEGSLQMIFEGENHIYGVFEKAV